MGAAGLRQSGATLLVLGLVARIAHAQLELSPGGNCVTPDGFLGDCLAAGACSSEAASSAACSSAVCCIRVSGDEVSQLPPSGALVFPAPATLPRGRRRSLLNPSFTCGGEGAPSRRRRRQTTNRPFVVGGSPTSIGSAVGVAIDDAHFESLWQQYQEQAAAGQARPGISRQQLRQAYQAAAAEEVDSQSRQWTCGAVLISERFMLTAAHCLQAGTPQVVRLGDRVLSSSSEASAPAEYRVTEVIPHPDYRPPSVYHDLALLRLDRDVQFGPHVRPFCLFDGSFSLAGRSGYVSGWGATQFGGGMTDTLMGGNITIWQRERCDRVYRRVTGTSRKLARGVTSGLLCAGGGARDACQGDSGGPMTVRTPAGTRLVGLVSSGVGCATEGVPGLYTYVVEYVDWIDEVLYGGD